MTERPDAMDAAMGDRVRTTAAAVTAPPALRARLAEQRVGARRSRRSALIPGLASAGLAAAAVALVLSLVLPANTGRPIGVAEAAALALSPAPGPAPGVDPTDPRLIRARAGALRFPNYAFGVPYGSGWEATGARRDHLGGRNATTVVYRGSHGQVGYTIVDGASLAVPAGARRVTVKGVRLAVLHRAGATVVTWRRAGATCVLATREVTVGQLVRFATWS